MGVDCFFVLSGFLITGILFDNLDAPYRTRTFYVRRTLRIFPLYYAVAFGVLLAWPLAHWRWDLRWLLWPGYAANLIGLWHWGPVDASTSDLIYGILTPRHGPAFNFGHFWSLCVEEQFYLIWPWIVFWLRRRRRLLWTSLVVLVACPILRLLAVRYLPGQALGTSLVLHGTPFRIDSLLFGAVAALLYRSSIRKQMVALARPLVWLAAVFFLFFLRPHAFDTSNGWNLFVETFGFSLIALLSAAVILRTLTAQSRLNKLFSFRPLRALGRISYGAYVFHDIPHAFYAYLAHGHRSVAALIALPCTALLATLSFRFLESPFLHLKTRFSLSAAPGP